MTEASAETHNDEKPATRPPILSLNHNKIPANIDSREIWETHQVAVTQKIAITEANAVAKEESKEEDAT